MTALVLIAPDTFHGALTAASVAGALAGGRIAEDRPTRQGDHP